MSADSAPVATPPVRHTGRLEPAEVADVLVLARTAGDSDGAYPLSEHVVLHIRHGGDAPAVHLLARDPDGVLAGYAHVDTTDLVAGASAELVVHPLRRRRGVGRALLAAAVQVSEQVDSRGRLRLWAHGDHPSASALALATGFERARVLWQMRRSLFAPVPEPELPEGVGLREFRPVSDDRAWLAVNARAFAEHPDQGRWTPRDLRIRMAEPWFDQAGFLIAEASPELWAGRLGGRPESAGGRLIGFHWTKVHGSRHAEAPPDGVRAHHHDPIGEVYVLGVDPAGHGLGLGTALTLAGLRHLRARGLDQAMLYVDESNTTAVALYRKLGFARWSTDVSLRRLV